MNFIYNILIAFILGLLSPILIDYLIFKFFLYKPVFTKGISTDVITFTEDYHEILISKLENDESYSIISKRIYHWFLSSKWIIFDIKNWLENLEAQDYVVIFEIIYSNSRIILTKEFVVNNESNSVTISSYITKQFNKISHIIDKNEKYTILITYSPLIVK